MTSIEWLWEQIPFEFTSKRSAFEIFEQAKEMHKQELIESHIDGQPLYSCQSEKAEQYYKKTFIKD